MMQQVQQRAADVIGLEGAAHATLAPVRAEHEVLDHQLAAALEQLAQANRAASVVKAVILDDAPPGQLPALLEECVALAGELLLLAQMSAVGGEPVLVGYDLVRCHGENLRAWIGGRARIAQRCPCEGVVWHLPESTTSRRMHTAAVELSGRRWARISGRGQHQRPDTIPFAEGKTRCTTRH